MDFAVRLSGRKDMTACRGTGVGATYFMDPYL